MVLEVLRHSFTGIQAGLQLGVGNVAGHDDGALQVYAGTDGIFGEFCTHGVDSLVQVYLNALRALAGPAEFFRNQFRRIGIHLLDPDAVGIDLGLDIAVCAAADAHTDGAAGAVAGQAHHTDVVGQVFAAELGAQTNLLGLFQKLFFQIDVTESTAGFVTRGGQVVVELDAGQLHGEKVLFGRCAADHESDVVRRAGGRTEGFHLLHQEGDEGAFVLDGGLGHGVEVRLVGAAAALGYHNETVFISLGGLDVYLGREVALGVDLVVHIQGSILAVAEVLLGIRIENAQAQGLFVLKIRPDSLALFTVDNGRSGILAEGKHTLDGSFCIAEELKGHILVVVRSLRITENLGYLQVVGSAKHELTVVERLLGHQREGLRRDFQDGLVSKLGGFHQLFGTGNLVVFSGVLAQLKHRCVFEFCHN